MKFDLPTSTVTIAERRFPCVCVICPPHDGPDPGTDWERMLGGQEGPGQICKSVTWQALIPCENGLLVGVETYDDKPNYAVVLYARTCRREPWDDTHIWMPNFVALAGRELVPDGVPCRWDDAEPEWTVELIDRVCRMPFTQPEGPEARLIPLAEAFALEPPDEQ